MVPPGHGDVYGALRRSGALATLLDQGFRVRDDLQHRQPRGDRGPADRGATSPRNGLAVPDGGRRGTGGERKGGHIARRRDDGQLVLREIAQTPPDDEDSFRDFRHWRYYNTNNLWIDLAVLSGRPRPLGGVLELPLIVNRKTVDPRDSSSTRGRAAGERDGGGDRELPRAHSSCACRARGSCR